MAYIIMTYFIHNYLKNLTKTDKIFSQYLFLSRKVDFFSIETITIVLGILSC